MNNDRKLTLRRLIEIIGDTKISNHIKGGQETLDKVDLAHYGKVWYPKEWVNVYCGLKSSEERVECYERLYREMPSAEQHHIIAGLSR